MAVWTFFRICTTNALLAHIVLAYLKCYFLVRNLEVISLNLIVWKLASSVYVATYTRKHRLGSGVFQLVGKHPNPSDTANSLQAAHPPDALAFHDLPSLKQ